MFYSHPLHREARKSGPYLQPRKFVPEPIETSVKIAGANFLKHLRLLKCPSKRRHTSTIDDLHHWIAEVRDLVDDEDLLTGSIIIELNEEIQKKDVEVGKLKVEVQKLEDVVQKKKETKFLKQKTAAVRSGLRVEVRKGKAAEKRKQKAAEIRKLRAQIQKLKTEIGKLKTEIRTLTTEIRKLKTEIQKHEAEVNKKKAKYENYKAKYDEYRDELKAKRQKAVEAGEQSVGGLTC
ncbi:stress response protein nst1-like [Trifolium pratense]|uniref:stress response protein nst1-like n=1 Tax=Trifolium pratense TaxID=57577 RepID=UPI001E690ED9|nr:stress response protein nst1-like [Trifolium pratense]XP_045795616.1 stress response protein nst1-like [Trifolium pratense]